MIVERGVIGRRYENDCNEIINLLKKKNGITFSFFIRRTEFQVFIYYLLYNQKGAVIKISTLKFDQRMNKDFLMRLVFEIYLMCR